MMHLLEVIVDCGDMGADILMQCNWLLGFALKALMAGITLMLILQSWRRS